MNVYFADILKVLINIQFTNTEEIEGRALGMHSICLNCLIILLLLWVFLTLTLIFIGRGLGGRCMDLLSKIHETNLTERSSMIRTNIWEILTSGWGRNDFVSDSKLDIKENLSIHQAILKQCLLDFLSIKQMHNIFSCISHNFYFSSDVKHGITHHATKKVSLASSSKTPGSF